MICCTPSGISAVWSMESVALATASWLVRTVSSGPEANCLSASVSFESSSSKIRWMIRLRILSSWLTVTTVVFDMSVFLGPGVPHEARAATAAILNRAAPARLAVRIHISLVIGTSAAFGILISIPVRAAAVAASGTRSLSIICGRPLDITAAIQRRLYVCYLCIVRVFK